VVASIFDQIDKAGGYSAIQDLAQSLILDGYDTQQLICKLNLFYATNPKVSDLHKARIAEISAESDFKMVQGGDEELNLLHTLSSINRVIKA